MEGKMRVCYPAELNLELMVIDDAGEKTGTVTIGLGLGEPVTLEDILERISRFETDELQDVAPGFRLPNRREFLERKFSEKVGYSVAAPSQEEFDT